jgi:glutamate racemase
MKKPIGIFDSGIGGLTVAYAVKKLMPTQPIIYFGDTAHLPYGDKSATSLQVYTIKTIDFLIEQGCEIILIACNSASAAAYELAKEYAASRAKIFDVIEPTVKYVSQNFANQNLGLIGTRQTVNSQVYAQKIKEKNANITLKSLATPLLAPMIEHGFFNNQVSKSALNEYLSNPKIQDIDAIILGCTHYPLIKKEIDVFYQQKVSIIDASNIIAQEVKNFLVNNDLLNQKQEENVKDKFYVSDYTLSFESTTKIFFNQKINLELYKLWE